MSPLFICPKCHKECGRNHDSGVICTSCREMYAKTASEVKDLIDHNRGEILIRLRERA